MSNMVRSNPSPSPARSVLFSIITTGPGYTSDLIRTQQSLWEQSSQDFEHVVGVNFIAVGPETVASVRELLEKPPQYENNVGRTVWMEVHDGQIAQSRNLAMTICSGEYLIFLNAGDVLAGSEVLSGLSDLVTQRNYDLLYGDSLVYQGHSISRLRARDMKLLKQGMITAGHSMTVRRQFLLDHRISFRQRLLLASDYYLLGEMYMNRCRSKQVPWAIGAVHRGKYDYDLELKGIEESLWVKQDLFGMDGWQLWANRVKCRGRAISHRILNGGRPRSAFASRGERPNSIPQIEPQIPRKVELEDTPGLDGNGLVNEKSDYELVDQSNETWSPNSRYYFTCLRQHSVGGRQYRNSRGQTAWHVAAWRDMPSCSYWITNCTFHRMTIYKGPIRPRFVTSDPVIDFREADQQVILEALCGWSGAEAPLFRKLLKEQNSSVQYQ